jgi:hypothetical protein
MNKMEKLIIQIEKSSQNEVCGRITTYEEDGYNKYEIDLMYWKGESVWRETAKLTRGTRYTYYPKGVNEKITYGVGWSFSIAEHEPIDISVVCRPIGSNLPGLQLASDPEYHFLPRYSAQEVQNCGFVFSNSWSIASEIDWLQNLRLDDCTYPKSSHCYGTFEIMNHSVGNTDNVFFAVGKKIKSMGADDNVYKVLTRCSYEFEQTHRSIFVWNIKTTDAMLKWLNVEWDDDLIIICYDSYRSSQIFGEHNRIDKGVYRLDSATLKQMNILSLKTKAVSKPVTWGKQMSTETLEAYLESF